MQDSVIKNETNNNNSRADALAKPDTLSGLINLLKASKGQKHLIIIQNYPDPDAISSALAHKIISAHYGVECDILYAGQISHPENIALIKILDIHLIRWHSEFDFSPYSGSIFVDNQGTTCGQIVDLLKAKQIEELIVVDHHELQEKLNAKFSDIRKVGATATIYSNYLQNQIIPFDTSQKDHIIVATALMHGIKTDTSNFVIATHEDFIAAAYLSKYVDNEALALISNQAKSKQAMEIIQQALLNRTTKEGFSIAGIGYIRQEDRDVIPQAADFLLTEENIHSVIVFGVLSHSDSGSEVLIGSMRTSKLTLDPDEFLKEVFGKDFTGKYFGGGKKTAGGFEIPVGFLSGGTDKEYKEMKWKLYKTQIMQKLSNKIGIADQNSDKNDLGK